MAKIDDYMTDQENAHQAHLDFHSLLLNANRHCANDQRTAFEKKLDNIIDKLRDIKQLKEDLGL